MTPFDTALEKAKLQLALHPNSVFLTTILYNMRIEACDKTPTASISQTTIKLNPDFFLGLSEAVRLFVLIHECGHAALSHRQRIGTRKHALYNIAGDHVINLQAKADGFTVWEHAYCDDQFKGMTTEEVYNELDAQGFEPSEEFNCDVDFNDQSEDADSEVQEILVRASIASKQAGQWSSVNNDIRRGLDELLNPKLPWHSILRKEFTASRKSKYSYSRPNRRFIPNLYLPIRKSKAMGELVIAVDLSGSIDQITLNKCLSESYALQKVLNPEKTTVLGFAFGITDTFTLTSPNQIATVKFSGSGGTDIKEVIDYVKENNSRCLVMFTDGYFDMPDLSDVTTHLYWVLINSCLDFKEHKGTPLIYE